MTTLDKTRVRWMTRADMAQVEAIEEECFQWDAWTPQDFTEQLRIRNVIGMVCERDECVAGYVIYALFKDRIEVWNFAVHPDFQRRGVGTALLNKLKGKTRPDRRSRLIFDVREENVGGHLFLRAGGFKCEGSVKFYEDACGQVPAYRFAWITG